MKNDFPPRKDGRLIRTARIRAAIPPKPEMQRSARAFCVGLSQDPAGAGAGTKIYAITGTAAYHAAFRMGVDNLSTRAHSRQWPDGHSLARGRMGAGVAAAHPRRGPTDYPI